MVFETSLYSCPVIAVFAVIYRSQRERPAGKFILAVCAQRQVRIFVRSFLQWVIVNGAK